MTELSPDDQQILDVVLKRVRHFEETLGSWYRDGLWSRMDELYHGWTQLRAALRSTSGRQRADVYNDARNEFGHELFVMYAYAIVETVLPALLSNRPRILILPNDKASSRNVENMKAVVDKQQADIGIELRFQTVVKSALKDGIGVGKSYWLRKEGMKQLLVPATSTQRVARMLRGETGEQTKWSLQTCAEPLFDDPTFEHVPNTRFGWDPFGASIDQCRYAYDVNFRDTGYIKDKLADPNGWTNMVLQPEDYEHGNGSADLYRKSVQGSFDAQAIPVPNPSGTREADIHEVIEYHDRAQIVTVLDRRWIVNVVPNTTNYGRLPFHVYRPTEVPNQMVGKGEIEPIEDLQREMNQMRTDRRWADLMALNPVLFYQEGIVEPDKIKVGPGELNGVNGDPRDLIWQLEMSGPKNSSYRETAEIAQDIVRASGISDTFAGGESQNAETATGVQLQMARASARIQNKTRRAELEMMKPVGEHWVRLNQRHIIENREIRVPAPPVPGDPERAWAHYVLGPNELAGNFDFDVDGGSTTPENTPQRRQDAQIKATIAASPLGQMLDPRQWTVSILEDLGVKNPEAMLAQGGQVPPETLDVIAQHLVEMGMDPNMARQLVGGSLNEVLDAKDQQAQGAQHGPPAGPPGQQQAQQQGPQQGPPQQQAA